MWEMATQGQRVQRYQILPISGAVCNFAHRVACGMECSRNSEGRDSGVGGQAPRGGGGGYNLTNGGENSSQCNHTLQPTHHMHCFTGTQKSPHSRAGGACGDLITSEYLLKPTPGKGEGFRHTQH